jgi:hypothetical protein
VNLLPDSIVYLHEDGNLGPRIIKGVLPTAGDGSDRLADHDGRERFVIADSGVSAEVLVFPPGEIVESGVEFHYGGTTWIITGVRRDSGVPVAEPSTH